MSGLAAPLAAVDPSLGTLVLLSVAGLIAGAVNSVAGGGSLISFPALLAAGYGSVTANVTNAIAVLPGYVGGSVAYRDQLRGQRTRVVALALSSASGALVGAWLLTVTSEGLFEALVPFLILGACGLLALQPWVSTRLRAPAAGEHAHRAPELHGANFLASVYGGYFGAGLGIMLLAVLALTVADDLHRLNALKGLLSLVVAVAAAVFFALFGPVAWGAAAVMAVASFVGGHLGVAVARRLSASVLRGVVVVFGVGVAVVLLAT